MVVEGVGQEVGVGLPALRVVGSEEVYSTGFRVGALAGASVGVFTAGGGALWERWTGARAEVGVDIRHAAAAFRSERYFRINGEELSLWGSLSGDYATADGWVRLHCNFDHHRDAALRALGIGRVSREEVARVCAGRTRLEVEEEVTRAGGCAGAMRTRQEWRSHPQAEAVAAEPVVSLVPLGPQVSASAGWGSAGSGESPAEGRPLAGVRVLDLTRVIAGPVAARALAAYGADVLRVGSAELPEVAGVVVETAFGKRSCHIDLRTDPEKLWDLVARADVIIRGYRPGALETLGFGAEELARVRPGIIVVDISAYGVRGPWAGRRGFDSLVQMVSGIAHEGGDGTRPQPLPCQALDHATGYLAAFAAVAGLLRRAGRGGSWHARLSLARTARWLDDLGRGEPGPDPRADDLLDTMDSAFGELTFIRPPGSIKGAEPYWSSPPPQRGEHPPAW
ncbi:CoA transferase [Acrocarpospora phusangensis]|uniref:CoA transferase n=1 Tax=Acrocarpospora phusangensis TaxID=1070424 RepID=UPI001EF17B63|nr:CoA transferase [Acrocarpospora phusangensis]